MQQDFKEEDLNRDSQSRHAPDTARGNARMVANQERGLVPGPVSMSG
jgi:hypothetical protein